MTKMTEDQFIARKKRLVSAARSLVAGQQGITVASNHVLGCLYGLGDEWVERYYEFKEYRNALPSDIPIGSERLLWEFNKLLELDPVLANLEFKYRSRLMRRCCEIITNYC